MPAPLSRDLRRRVITAVEGGYSRREAARLFQVSESTAVKWLRDWAAEGRDQARRMGAPSGSVLDAHADFLLKTNEAEPDLTLEEFQRRLARRGVQVGLTAIWTFFQRRGITLKKNSSRKRAATQGRRTGPHRLAGCPGRP